MGIFFPRNIVKFSCIRLSVCRNIKLLQVVKIDGKVIEFTSPLLVKDLLVNFEGIDVKSSRKAFNNLPSNFELKLGKIYYLLPSKAVHQAEKQEAPISSKAEAKPNMTVNRIKVVITKKQLQELLTKKTTVEQICGIDKSCLVDSPSQWKPGLVSIPEEEESFAL